MNRPDLIWSSYPKEKKDRFKGFILISSLTIAVILLGVVMIYG